jgi:hypothetical protein
MVKPKRDPEAPVPISASVPIEVATDEGMKLEDLIPTAIVANRCERCEHWLRLTIQRTPTSFGTCHRWSTLMVEDRGGVQATPFAPTTPSHALCAEYK